MKNFVCVGIALVWVGLGAAFADVQHQRVLGEPANGIFDKWLAPDSPQCVALKDIKAVSTVTELTPEQFQFVRALYVAIPPISRKLPPGDHAIQAISGDSTMIALVGGGEACARFLAPDFIKVMLTQVVEGGAGQPL
jgi:hypothetical protein